MGKESKRQKAKLKSKQLLAIILAGLMVSGTIAAIIISIISMSN